MGRRPLLSVYATLFHINTLNQYFNLSFYNIIVDYCSIRLRNTQHYTLITQLTISISDLRTFRFCNGWHIYTFIVTSTLATISSSTPSFSTYPKAVTGHPLKLVHSQWLSANKFICPPTQASKTWRHEMLKLLTSIWNVIEKMSTDSCFLSSDFLPRK